MATRNLQLKYSEQLLMQVDVISYFVVKTKKQQPLVANEGKSVFYKHTTRCRVAVV